MYLCSSQSVKLDKIQNLTLKWNFLYNVCLGKWDQTEFSEKVILPISFKNILVLCIVLQSIHLLYALETAEMFNIIIGSDRASWGNISNFPGLSSRPCQCLKLCRRRVRKKENPRGSDGVFFNGWRTKSKWNGQRALLCNICPI